MVIGHKSIIWSLYEFFINLFWSREMSLWIQGTHNLLIKLCIPKLNDYSGRFNHTSRLSKLTLMYNERSEWDVITCLLGFLQEIPKYPIKFDIRDSIVIERCHWVSVNSREAIYIFSIPFAAICCLTIKLKHQNMVNNILIN